MFVYMQNFVPKVSPEEVLSTVIPLFNKLADDDQDSVRLLTVEVLVSLAQRLSKEQRQELLLPAFKALSSDKAWRVRYMVASKYVEVNECICFYANNQPLILLYIFQLAESYGQAIVRDNFTTAFVNLLRDTEGEVRTAGASQIPGYAKFIDENVILQDLLPCVKLLVSDENQHARAALAKDISGLAPIIGQDA